MGGAEKAVGGGRRRNPHPTSPTFAGIMGFYGMGWSVFNNIVARGSEVEFGKNAAMDIRFGVRPPAPGTKFKHADARSAGGEL